VDNNFDDNDEIISDEEDAVFGVRRTRRETNWFFQYNVLLQTETVHQQHLDNSLQVHHTYMEKTIDICVFLSMVSATAKRMGHNNCCNTK